MKAHKNSSASAVMMRQLSPATRKILALAVLILGLVLIWILIFSPVAAQMEGSLTKLQDTRFQLTRLEQIKTRAEPEKVEPIPAKILVTAKTREEAVTQIGIYLNGLAAKNGLQVARIIPRSGNEGSKLIAFDFALTGEEVGVAQFINRLERGYPAMRLRSWQIATPETAGRMSEAGAAMPNDLTIEFSGQAVAAWTKP